MPHIPPRILISNHDHVYLNLMEELLIEEGYQATVESNSAKAYQMVLKERYDLVILDIPIMTPDAAWTFLNTLHLNPVTRSIPILICSTNVQFMREAAGDLEAKGIAMLPKPFNLEDMLAKIRMLLDRGTAA